MAFTYQASYSGSGTGASINITVTFNAGDSIDIYVVAANGSTVTVTDNATPPNTYTAATTVAYTARSLKVSPFWATNIPNGATTLTFTHTGGALAWCFADRYSGEGAATLNAQAGNTATTTDFTADNAFASGSDIGTSGDRNSAFCFDQNVSAISVGTGYTQRLSSANLAMTEDKSGAGSGLFSVDTSDYVAKMMTFTPPVVALTYISEQPQFSIRRKQDYAMLAATSKQDEQWPFTAVGTPSQFGWDNPERFPLRRRHRTFQSADEQWPFTATATPGPLGWLPPDPHPVRRRYQPPVGPPEFIVAPLVATTPTGLEWAWDPQFPNRRRFRPSQSADEQWPFTAVATPKQFGWDNPEKFSPHIRFRPARSADEQWPFTAAPTPTQFGWQLDPQFSFRRHFRPVLSSDEQWPFTATPTPTQLGFLPPDPIPVRRRFRPPVGPPEFISPPLVVVTPSGFEWAWDPQVPVRRRFRPSQSADEQWPFTATATPAQFGWQIEPSFPARYRFRPLVYDPFSPAPPVAASFQQMTGTATKVRIADGATLFKITLQGTGVFVFSQIASDALLNEALPFGSAHIVLVSGTAPASVALATSNDGVNFFQLGPSVTYFPAMLSVTSTALLSSVAFCYHAWVVTGGDATTQLAITEIFRGWRG